MLEEFDHFDALYQEIDKKISQVVRAAAFNVERGAKQRAAVDTGFMRSSIYVRTEESSDNTASGAEAFPEIEAPEHNAALIAVGAKYGIYLEYGTSRAGAQPFLIPALEAERTPFLMAIKAIEGLGD